MLNSPTERWKPLGPGDDTTTAAGPAAVAAPAAAAGAAAPVAAGATAMQSEEFQTEWANAEDAAMQWAAAEEWVRMGQFGSYRLLCDRRASEVAYTLKDVWDYHDKQRVYLRPDRIDKNQRSTEFDVQLHGICGKVRVDGHLNHPPSNSISLACMCAQRGDAVTWATLDEHYPGLLQLLPRDVKWTTFRSEPKVVRKLDGVFLSALAVFSPHVDVATDDGGKMTYRSGMPLSESTIFMGALQMAATPSSPDTADEIPPGAAQLVDVVPEVREGWSNLTLPWTAQYVFTWSIADGIHRVAIRVSSSSHAHLMLFKWATLTLTFAYAPHRQELIAVASKEKARVAASGRTRLPQAGAAMVPAEPPDTSAVEQSWLESKKVIMAELIDRLFYIGAAAYPMVDCEYLCSLFVQPIATGVQMQYLSSLPAGLPGSGSAAFQTDDSCSVSVVESMGELVRQADQQQWSKKCVRCGQDNGMYLKRLDALEAIITAGALHQFVCCRWCVCTQCV